MAFEILKAHREYIEGHKSAGKTLAQIVELLADTKQVATTTGTLSRYLKEIGSPYKPRELTSAENVGLDQTVLLTEIFAEVQGAKEEMRGVIEHLGGKVAVLSQTIEEFEKSLSRATPEAAVIRQIWRRALLITLLVNAAVIGAAAVAWLFWR